MADGIRTQMAYEYVTTHDATDKRRAKAEGGVERRLTEAAVMLAVAIYILNHAESGTVRIHPDGEHAKRFDIPAWLAAAGFTLAKGIGSTSYGGAYVRGAETVVVDPRPGLGDVEGEVDGRPVVVECKGGAINSSHAGQLSRLRRGLCEAIGLLLARAPDGAREIAAAPWTPTTAELARRLGPRCASAGIEIALVRPDGSIEWSAS